ncbi:MAG TPA: hypothetical protein VH482_11750 [Thermomicrobiales bacterium]
MTTEDIEREIRATMRERGIDYDEAEVFVGMKYGELHNDLLYMGRLTDEQRRRHRRTLLEVMAELGELEDEPDGFAEAEATVSHRRELPTD